MRLVMSLLRVTVGIIVVIAASKAAQATFQYSDPVVARTHGLLCRGDTPELDNGALAHGSFGTANRGNDPMTVWCPIIRRNTAPFQKENPHDGIGDPGVNMTVADIYLNQEFASANSSCQVFARNHRTGSTTISPKLFTCAFYPNGGCSESGGLVNGPASLHWNDPLVEPHDNEGTINIGFVCTLPVAATVIGSVVRFVTQY